MFLPSFRRNTKWLFNQVNHACELLRSMCENLLHNKETEKDMESSDNDNLLSITLSEKNELIHGFMKLYNTSGKLEQVRLLSIAPVLASFQNSGILVEF